MDLKLLIKKLQKDRRDDSEAGLKNSAEGEKYLQQSYEGRFLFELIQNARDANKLAGVNGKIAINVKEGMVVVSNTGKAFDEKGIEGITLIGSSTKSGQGFIGFKGIGFKSILEISEVPNVRTEFGTVLFDRGKTASLLAYRNLKKNSIPLFFIPHYDDDKLSEIELQAGIVTEIRLPFKTQIDTEKIWNSFTKIGIEQLVLLGFIDSLSYEDHNRSSLFQITNDPKKNIIHINQDGESSHFVHYEPKVNISIPIEIIEQLEEKEKSLFIKESTIELSLVFDCSKKNKLQKIKQCKLYLYYPTEIWSGFSFIIHSSFIVNPERKVLRNSVLNEFILKETAKYLATEWLKVAKRQYKDCYLDLLVFERNHNVDLLSNLYDNLVMELVKQDFIYDPISKKYYNVNKVIIADGFDKEIFPENELKGKRLIYIGNEITRDWLINEFDAEYLSVENLAENIERECHIHLQRKNIAYFDNLYKYLTENSINVGDRKILLTNDMKLRKPSEDVFFVPEEKYYLPQSIKKKIFFIHPKITIQNIRENKAGFLEFNTELLVNRLLKLFDNKATPNVDVLEALLHLKISERLLPNIKDYIKIPVGDGKWLNPLLNPVYIDDDKLLEIYPEDRFINYDILTEIKLSKNELNNKLVEFGAFNIPGVYYKSTKNHISRNNDYSRFSSLLRIEYFTTDFFVVEGDWILDIPDTKNKWFTISIIEHWSTYNKIINNNNSTRIKYSTQRSDYRFPNKTQTFEISSFLKFIKEEKWILLENNIDALTVEKTVGIDPIEYKQSSTLAIRKYLSLIPLQFSYNKDFVNKIGLKHLDTDSIDDFISIFNLIASQYKSMILREDFSNFFNRVLGKLFEWYISDSSFATDILKLEGCMFLAINSITNEYVFEKAKNIYYIEDKPSYEILPDEVKKSLQPQFTNRDKNKFGRIGKRIGKDFKNSIHTKIIAGNEIRRNTLYKEISVFPELLAFIECLLDSNLDSELKEFKEISFIFCSYLHIELSIENKLISKLSNVGFKIDLDNKQIYITKKSFFALEINLRCNLIYDLFTLILSRDLSRLNVPINDFLISNNPSVVLSKYAVPVDRVDEIKLYFNDIIFSKKDEFWIEIMQSAKYSFDHLNSDAIFETAYQFCLSKDIDIVKFEDLNYEDLNADQNRFLLTELFDKINLDVSVFNTGSLTKIDFSHYYNKKLEALKHLNKDKYFNNLYLQLKQVKDFEKMSEFQDLIDSYSLDDQHLLNYPVLKFEYQSFFQNYISKYNIIETISDKIDWKKDFDKNYKKLFYDLISDGFAEEQIENFLSFSANRSLLYFDNTIDYLICIFKEDNKVRAKSTSQINPIAEDLANYSNLPDLEIQNIETVRFDHLPQKSENSFRGDHIGQRRVDGGNINNNNERIGLLAEKLVYDALLKRKYKKVEWVSKNAAKAGINPEGTDTLGYDMFSIDENDNIIYYEVKGSSGWENNFYVSYPEYCFAVAKMDDYNIIRVLNVFDNSNRQILNIGNIFLLSESEHIFENQKFSAQFKTLEISYNVKN